MSTLHIDLDERTVAALSALAESRGTTPVDLATEIVSEYVSEHDRAHQPEPFNSLTGIPIAEVLEKRDRLEELAERYLGRRLERDESGVTIRRHDPLDDIVGSIDSEPVDDIDEVIYG